jgi:hypothetical protein
MMVTLMLRSMLACACQLLRQQRQLMCIAAAQHAALAWHLMLICLLQHVSESCRYVFCVERTSVLAKLAVSVLHISDTAGG